MKSIKLSSLVVMICAYNLYKGTSNTEFTYAKAIEFTGQVSDNYANGPEPVAHMKDVFERVVKNEAASDEGQARGSSQASEAGLIEQERAKRKMMEFFERRVGCDEFEEKLKLSPADENQGWLFKGIDLQDYRKVGILVITPNGCALDMHLYALGLHQVAHVRDIPNGIRLLCSINSCHTDHPASLRCFSHRTIESYPGLEEFKLIMLQMMHEAQCISDLVSLRESPDFMISRILLDSIVDGEVVNVVECKHKRLWREDGLGKLTLVMPADNKLRQLTFMLQKYSAYLDVLMVEAKSYYKQRYPDLLKKHVNRLLTPEAGPEMQDYYAGLDMQLEAFPQAIQEAAMSRPGIRKLMSQFNADAEVGDLKVSMGFTMLRLQAQIINRQSKFAEARMALEQGQDFAASIETILDLLADRTDKGFEITNKSLYERQKGFENLPKHMKTYTQTELLQHISNGIEVPRLFFENGKTSGWIFAAKFIQADATERQRSVVPVAPKQTMNLDHLLHIQNEATGADLRRINGHIPVFKLSNPNDRVLESVCIIQDGVRNDKFTNFLHAALNGEEVTLGVGCNYRCDLLRELAKHYDKRRGVNVHLSAQFSAGKYCHLVATTIDGIVHIYFVGNMKILHD